MQINSDYIIGKQILYEDYLGFERSGRIVAIEFTNTTNVDGIAYIYIEDEDTEFNVHQDVVNGQLVTYAELRPSNEVYLDDIDY